MPAQVAKSGLMAKYGGGLSKAVETHAEDATDYGIIRLPGGISNGVAKLTECKFDIYKTGQYKGEYYFQARGVVVRPESILTKDGEMKVEGLQTMLMEPVCTTKNQKGIVTSQEEHVTNILNEMRKLGGEAFTAGATGADLEPLAATLKEAGIYFRFSTSQSPATKEYPDPRVWENWNGACEAPGDEENAVDSVEDETVAVAETPPAVRKAVSAALPKANGAVAKSTPPPKPTGKTPVKAPPKVVAPPPEPEPEFNEFGDIASLVEAAGGEGPESVQASNTLTDMALKAGYSEEEVTGATDWGQVGEMIENPKEPDAAEEEAEGEPEEFLPIKGETCKFYPTDQTTKKPGKKVTECEIVAVDPKTKTVNLKSLDTKTTYKGVPWARLS